MDLIDTGKGLTLNTNGHCFICLDNTGNEEERSYSVISGLFRFLNVDYCETLLKDIGKVSSSQQQRHQNAHCLEKDYLKVELCIACKEKKCSFVELLTALEKLEMEITDCLKTVQERILKANGDSNKQGKMTQAYMGKVDKLRNRVSEKCSKVIAGSFPRVILKKLNDRDYDVRTIQAKEPSNTNGFPILLEVKDGPKDTTNEVQFPELNTANLKPGKDKPAAHHTEKFVKANHRILDKRVPTDSSRSKSLVCSICQKGFNFRTSLIIHMKQAHEKRRGHKCDKCNQTFSKPCSLWQHKETAHLGLKYFCQAPNCSSKYCNKEDMLLHLKMEHPNFGGEVRFVRCQEVEESRSTTKLSSKSSTAILSLGSPAAKSKNTEASKKLTDNLPSTRFLKSVTNDTTQKDADTELNSLDNVDDYTQVLDNAINEKKKRCSICNQQFASHINLKLHIKRIHLKESGAEKCDKCDKTFNTPYNLRVHREATHLKIRHTCNFPGCAMQFAYENTMIRHQKMKHPNYNGGITVVKSKKEDREGQDGNEFILPD